MAKIGIVSIHSAHNYGSVLQAYALQNSLFKYSDDVEIINYRPKYFEIQYKLFSLKIYKSFPGLLNKVLHLGWRIVFFPKRLVKYNKFEKFINNRMILTKKYSSYNDLFELENKYDVLICGSDQIWNTDITEGFDKSYYLGFAGNKTIKSSYAASIARKEIDKKYANEYIKYLSDFDFVSIREKDSLNEIAKYVNKYININIDPTLLLDRNEWSLIAADSKIHIDYDYIFVYILQDNPEFVKIVNKLSEELNLRVLSISKKKRFKNETIIPNAGPEDFLKLISNSAFVITNSFHGTVFSLVFEKRNCIIPHLNTGSRMIDLMCAVGLNDRIITEEKALDVDKIKQSIDYTKVKSILANEKKKSFEYFNKIINSK